MAGKNDFPQPTFTIEDDGEFAELRLKSLENDIYKKPRIYTALIERLGATLTDGTIAVSEQPQYSETVSNNAAHRLREFFTLRFDRLIEFDDATETFIARDEQYRELLQVHRSSANRDVKLGVQKKGSLPDPNAEPARDKLRRKRLELFVGRVAQWQELQSKAQPKRQLKKVV